MGGDADLRQQKSNEKCNLRDRGVFRVWLLVLKHPELFPPMQSNVENNSTAPKKSARFFKNTYQVKSPEAYLDVSGGQSYLSSPTFLTEELFSEPTCEIVDRFKIHD